MKAINRGIRSSFHSWGVCVAWKDSLDVPFLAGRYWFDQKTTDGCLLALFDTRKKAREAIKTKTGTKAYTMHPVKVRVTANEV
jgi:hypothetical protein